MITQNTHTRVAQEIRLILGALGGDDADFSGPMLRAVLVRCHDYLNGCLKLSTLIWHLQRFRNEAMTHDAKESGE